MPPPQLLPLLLPMMGRRKQEQTIVKEQTSQPRR
jgi:hypothetical protein